VLGFRRARDVMRSGRTRFLDTADPVLAFERISGEDRLVCVFNLSPGEVEFALSSGAVADGPSGAADLTGGTLSLGPNGYVYLRPDGPDFGLTVTARSKAAMIKTGTVQQGSISG